ncbi:hypothetical protein AALK14_06265 [Butyricimonas hominis]|uniref:hypothetical protein n=1 Tax=Butyricimonas TaxID=574697 RepID=UPI003511EEE6
MRNELQSYELDALETFDEIKSYCDDHCVDLLNLYVPLGSWDITIPYETYIDESRWKAKQLILELIKRLGWKQIVLSCDPRDDIYCAFHIKIIS